MESVQRNGPNTEQQQKKKKKKTTKRHDIGEAEDDENDRFFESTTRFTSSVPIDNADSSSSDEDEAFEDSHIFFSSTTSNSAPKIHDFEAIQVVAPPPMFDDYDIWMSDPDCIQQRRKRLLQGMGLSTNENLRRVFHTAHAATKMIGHGKDHAHAKSSAESSKEDKN